MAGCRPTVHSAQVASSCSCKALPVPRVGDPSPLRGNDLPTATQLVGVPARNRAPWASPGPGHPLCLDLLEKGHLADSAQPERVGLSPATLKTWWLLSCACLHCCEQMSRGPVTEAEFPVGAEESICLLPGDSCLGCFQRNPVPLLWADGSSQAESPLQHQADSPQPYSLLPPPPTIQTSPQAWLRSQEAFPEEPCPALPG